MRKTFLLVLTAMILAGCTDSNVATRALSGAGYKNIQITGYSVFGCSDEDFFHTGFEATGVDGSRVSGTVCSGFFKGATIRMD